MGDRQNSSAIFEVYVRWRPLTDGEKDTPELDRIIENHKTISSISISNALNAGRTKPWKSGASFTHVFDAADNNKRVYDEPIAAMLPCILQGGTCNLFAYGHSGSGKTHTIIGYDFEDDKHLGLSIAAARDLYQAIEGLNARRPDEDARSKDQLSIAVRLYEVRGSYAYDLLNNSAECHVREGPDGRTHIRGATEMLGNGKVRVRPILALPCSNFTELKSTMLLGLENRAVGSSSVHDESSRTHAILELEVVSQALIDAREALIERESELVPVGKRATDVYLEESMASLIKNEDGTYVQNPERPVNQARIDAAEAEKVKFEARVRDAEEAIAACFSHSGQAALGGKFVFVDLAGSEYFDQSPTATTKGPKQTPQEKKQGRQINTDLFALKEVIRARAEGKARIPYRSSPLTMVLRSHFQVTENARSAMILTVSSSESQYAATMNTLKYGNLVGLGAS